MIKSWSSLKGNPSQKANPKQGLDIAVEGHNLAITETLPEMDDPLAIHIRRKQIKLSAFRRATKALRVRHATLGKALCYDVTFVQ